MNARRQKPQSSAHMLIRTMSEIARAKRALCFSNAVSSWQKKNIITVYRSYQMFTYLLLSRISREICKENQTPSNYSDYMLQIMFLSWIVIHQLFDPWTSMISLEGEKIISNCLKLQERNKPKRKGTEQNFKSNC